MDLASSLREWDGKAVAPMEALYESWMAEGGSPSELLDYLDGDENTQTSASWLLKRHVDGGGRLSGGESTGLLRRLEELSSWEAKLHVLQILHAVEISEAGRYQLEDFLRSCLAEKNKFVRAWTFNAFHLLAQCYPDLRREVDAMLEDALATEAASVKARIRNLPGWKED